MLKLFLSLMMLYGMALSGQSKASVNNSNAMKYTVLVLYRVQPAFLSLSREERNLVFANEVGPIIQQFAGRLEVRMFDSEAFHAKTSDFLIVSCADLKDYYQFIEHLRDTSLFGVPYIALNDVVLGIENGFVEFEKEMEND